MSSLAAISNKLSQHRARRVPGRRWMTRCGVAVLLDESQEEGLRVLLMRRARRPGDPWSGDMSFPGGRMSPPDLSPLDTAVRETSEEIGLQIASDSYIGRLSDVVTRKHEHWRPMIVTPYVFRLTGKPDLNLGHEAETVIQVPLRHFAKTSNRQLMYWNTGRVTWEMPCFFYQDCRIWGLTLYMLRELVGLEHGTHWRTMRFKLGQPRGEGEVLDRRP